MNETWIFKPCPFCGSTEIEVGAKPIEYKAWHDCPCSVVKKVWAICKICGAEGRKKTADVVYDEEILAAAIEGWNERIPLARAVAAMKMAKHDMIGDYGFNGGIEFALSAINDATGGTECSQS